jgi:hypothetical protein
MGTLPTLDIGSEIALFKNIFKSKSNAQYTKYVQSERKKDSLIKQFKFKCMVNDIILTPSQERVIKAVSDYLEETTNIGKGLLYAIYGKAGVGKSQCILKIGQKFEKKGLAVQIIGPTGFCVSQHEGAQTIHSFLEIGITSSYENLVDKVVSKSVHRKINKLHCLIIDEGGLIGAHLFQFLNVRLQRIRENSDLFGGLSVIFILDPLQIPCINSKPIWSSELEVNDQFGRDGVNAFKKFRFFLLSENVRQKNDPSFENLLDKFRLKTVKEDDIELLRTRLSKNVTLEEKNNFYQNAIFLFGTNAECDAFNLTKLKDLNKPIHHIPVKLSKSLQLAVGCKVILNRNLWTQAGLASGVKGVVTGFLYDRRARPGFQQPVVIFVRFDNSIGIKCCELGSIPIPRVSVRLFDKEQNRWTLARTFPLMLSFGITIARSQSATFSLAAILFGKEFLCQQSYVALSRVRKLSNLLILNDDLKYERFSDWQFNRGFDKLISNLKSLGLDVGEKKEESNISEFDSEGDELMFQIEL